MTKLLIVESPAKAKTISKYLDKTYIVKASVGHVRDLPKSNKDAIDTENGFMPRYEIVEAKKKIVDELKNAAANATDIILATDPDREGEAIAWHLIQALDLDGRDARRIVFHEITKSALEEALAHPRRIDTNLRKAQEARRVLDRLFGYDLSGLIWKKVRYGLSAGRVQSPALRILVEREREIGKFKPQTYWVISIEVKTKKGTKFLLICTQEPKTKKWVKNILSVGKKANWVVSDVKTTKINRSPRPPFTTSTLQQTASSRFGMSPSQTMRAAQRLYEAGHITYMRTDSMNLSSAAQKTILGVVSRSFGKEYAHARTYKSTSKNIQEAHEAIRPTNPTKTGLGKALDQKKLYTLIWSRTVASQMAQAELNKTSIVAIAENEKIPEFRATGSQLIFPGWLAADPKARGEDVELPKVAKGDKLSLISIDAEEKETQPPSRYSEAGLVKELEKRGIGRPSTYAPTIRTIQTRGYVEKLGRSLKPTDVGEVVSTFLEEHFVDYISDSFTSNMENKLDDIAQGKRDYEKTLRDFYTPFTKAIKSKEKMEKITTLEDAPKKYKCPECKAHMVIKLGRNGKFMSCSTFPDCSGIRNIDGEKLEGIKKTGEKCSKCKNGELVERDGRYGRFVACGNYPKCKFVKQNPEQEKQALTGVACPACGKGEMSERRGRFGIFYGCSNYPSCKNAIKAKPTGKTCGFVKEDGSVCVALEMLGTKTIPERCSDKACPNHNPHKMK